MKNKKLLTRLFALLASLVLVFALALPCFAEEIDRSLEDYVLVRVYSFDDLLSLNLVSDVLYSAVFYEEFLGSTTIGHLRYDGTDNYFVYNGSGSFADSNIASTVHFNDDGTATYDYNITYFADTPEDGSVDLYSFEFALYVFVPSDLLDNKRDPSTPSSDMYSNLFNILKDAVYGSDAELTGSQEYALTLISTILTYATILLPVILVIFIAVWCFKRF